MASKAVLWYWPGLPGRGEPIRWALEDAGIPYIDKGLEKATGGTLMKMLFENSQPVPAHSPQSVKPLSPPFLEIDGQLISHVANILLYLGDKHPGVLAPKDPAARYAVNALQLSIADYVVEVHDTHHPIAISLYYEDQKEESLKRAKEFRENRLPRYMNYFAEVLGDRDWLVGDHCTYADLSLVQAIQGTEFAFPKAAKRVLDGLPGLRKLAERVTARPNLKAYFSSERHQAFNATGIYRKYPELDE
ncbi:glutathione S-transferase [Hyaloraphidium curvatum]|nr:glutathione S-transferase [Hyaloraphidium curvatum]